MKFTSICNFFQELENTGKRNEKALIINEFLKVHKENWTLDLLLGKVFLRGDLREINVSESILMKAIGLAFKKSEAEIFEAKKKFGDLGLVAFHFSQGGKALLDAEKTINKIRSLSEIEGKESVAKKVSLISDLLSKCVPIEAKFLCRIIEGDMKIGVGSAFLNKEISGFKLGISPGNPVDAMLFSKVKTISDAFKTLGKPCAFEYKYDGFRVIVSKDEKGSVKIFTRRLEEVSGNFPEIVEIVKKIKAKSFIFDGEAVSIDKKTGKYLSFETISRRIKRKYDIAEMAKNSPVELNVFDVLFLNGENLSNEPNFKRRKILEKIVENKKGFILKAERIETGDIQEAENFMEKSLSVGHEGLMAKSILGEYKVGQRSVLGVKIKPEDRELDLVITGADFGKGKRVGTLSSFYLSCLGEKGELLGLGKVSTGLKEKSEDGLSFKQMTEIIKDKIVSEKGNHVEIKPFYVVTVLYQNIQKSPTYSSGLALRFPRIKTLRPDKSVSDIATLKEVQKEF